ncbi:hypothetical protein V6N13_104903 [Hibiscus sabdariffa]|uniref:Uncharacterized protein n=2 Tax=Hibiscus sabdariffa TaxID=183260 RepID=A0ABR2SJ95_9ROSI
MKSGKGTCKSEGSRSSRMKTSLIKKFVPKKLRHGKGKKQGKSVGNKDKEASSSELEMEKEMEKEKQEPGDGEEDGSETEQGDMASTSDQLLQGESGTERVRKGNSGYVILIVLLAGLVGGRGVALLPTLVCCFILMYIGTHTKKK